MRGVTLIPAGTKGSSARRQSSLELEFQMPKGSNAVRRIDRIPDP
jgi:hypothetical protein